MLRRQNEKLLALISRQTNRLLTKLRKSYDKREVTNMEVELTGLEYQMLERRTDQSSIAKREMFHDYLAKLDEPIEVRILTLRFIEGMSFKEIALEENLSTSKVYRVYQQSIQKIRDRIT